MAAHGSKPHPDQKSFAHLSDHHRQYWGNAQQVASPPFGSPTAASNGHTSGGIYAHMASGFDREAAKHALDLLDKTDLGVKTRPADQIQPGLFLGDLKSARDHDFLEAKRISRILTVCPPHDLSFPSHLKIEHKVLDVEDDRQSDLLDHFQDTFRFIQYGLDEGHRILVHCEQGISRSATVLAAFLMKSERYHPIEAIRYIQRFRPIADPNPGFRKQLEIWGATRGELKGTYEYTQWKESLTKGSH